MSQRRLSTGHQAIAELDDLWYTDDQFRVILLVGQPHEEVEYFGKQLFGVGYVTFLDKFELLHDEADENFVRVHETVVYVQLN